MQSLDCSRRIGARAWELRTAIDLAELRAAQGRPEAARGCSAAGVRPIPGGLRYSGSEGCRMAAGDLGESVPLCRALQLSRSITSGLRAAGPPAG